MKYTRYTKECCQFLSSREEAESDALIPHFIQMQKLADDVNRTFDYDGHQELGALDSRRVEMLVKTFREQLARLEKTFPAEFWKHGTYRHVNLIHSFLTVDIDMLIMAYYHLRTFVNEVGFHQIALSPLDSISNQVTSDEWYSSITRSELLISCLNAAKDYLERYISLPTESLFSSSFADYAKLVYNVLILRLFQTWAKDDNLPMDAANLQSSTNMAPYMEALVRKFESMSKIGSDCGLIEDYTVWLAELFRSYQGQGQEKTGARLIASKSYPDMSVMQIAPFFASPTPVHLSSYDSSSSVSPRSQDNSERSWADVFFEWTPSLDPQDLSIEAPFA
jgi:hypothetical protein